MIKSDLNFFVFYVLNLKRNEYISEKSNIHLTSNLHLGFLIKKEEKKGFWRECNFITIEDVITDV